MNFAKKELEKSGWNEGLGSSKKNDGISTALKPKLEFDNSGVGHNPGNEFSNRLWEDFIKLTSWNLKVQKNDEVKLGTKNGKSTDMDTNPYASPLRRNNELEYGSFIKTSQLTESGVVNYQVEGSEKKTDTDRPRRVYNEAVYIHKGARFGIHMSGKLNRLERQEMMLLKKMRNISLTEAPILEKKVKELKKSKGVAEVELALETITVSPIEKKKKHRSVSFREVATEYYPPTEDTNSESSRIDENIEPHSPESVSSTPDQGNEVDLNMNKTNKTVIKFDDLSKTERKKFKKKRGNRTAVRFLSNIDSINIRSKFPRYISEETHCRARIVSSSQKYSAEVYRIMTELCEKQLEDDYQRLLKKRKITLSQTEKFQCRHVRFMNLSSHDEEYNKMSEDQVNSKGQLKSKDHKKNRDQIKNKDRIKNMNQHQEGTSIATTDGRKDKHDNSALKRKRKNEKQINEIVQSFSDCQISDDKMLEELMCPVISTSSYCGLDIRLNNLGLSD